MTVEQFVQVLEKIQGPLTTRDMVIVAKALAIYIALSPAQQLSLFEDLQGRPTNA